MSAVTSASVVAAPRQPPAAELAAQAGRAAAATDWATAIGLYEKARSQAPADAGAQSGLAAAYQGRAQARQAGGDFDGAAADFTAAEKLGQPGAADGRKQAELARHYAAAEAAWGYDDDTVLRELEAVYALDPSYREVVEKLYAALLGLADRQVAAGDVDGATATLERALALAPDRPEAQAQLTALHPPAESETAGQSSTSSGGDWRSLWNELQRHGWP